MSYDNTYKTEQLKIKTFKIEKEIESNLEEGTLSPYQPIGGLHLSLSCPEAKKKNINSESELWN